LYFLQPPAVLVRTDQPLPFLCQRQVASRRILDSTLHRLRTVREINVAFGSAKVRYFRGEPVDLDCKFKFSRISLREITCCGVLFHGVKYDFEKISASKRRATIRQLLNEWS